MRYWKYIDDESIQIWERNPALKQERCIYERFYDGTYQKHPTKWWEWDCEEPCQEENYDSVEEITREEAFLEMI